MELANNGNLQSIVPVLGVFEGNLSVNGNNGSLNFAAISSRAQLR